MPRKIEQLTLAGPAGDLEALLEEPEDRPPAEAFVVCHPHPLHGGTMHNKVVYRLARGLRRAGAAALRFNFRGVGRSQGEYGEGKGEVEDARAALRYLKGRSPGLRLSLAGFSFGSRVILNLGCALSEVERLVAVGFPTRVGNPHPLAACPKPKIFIQSTADQYGPRSELESLFENLGDPKQLIWVEASDHFFAGALEEFEEAVYGVGLSR